MTLGMFDAVWKPAVASLAMISAIQLSTPPVARAQDVLPAASPSPSAAKTTTQKTPSAKANQAAAPSSSTASGGGGDAGLRQRVEQLEEQIVDMQVVIGTLESLAKAPQPSPSAAPQRGGNPGESARVERLEQQLQTLSAQMRQLSNKAPGLVPDRRSEFGPAPVPGGQPPYPPTASTGSVSTFGSTTVTSDQGDPIAGMLAGQPPPAKAGEALPDVSAAGSPPGPVAALTPAEGSDPQQLYSSAYGFLLGQNYGAAQTGFQDFLRKNPRDALAPDALFWLGEAHYMQKNYKDAADAFDLVTSSYGSSAKAPEAQVRRAAALVQLGRKDEACTALRQLNTKYPNARPVLKTKADAERQRAGCT